MSIRFQTVGSLLRPADLLAYKSQIQSRDDVTYPFYAEFPGYEQCEEAATRAVVAQQIEHGIAVLTDGEFSKSLWHTDFVWGLGGIDRYIADHGYWFRDLDGQTPYETRRDIGWRITGPLSGHDHHFIFVWKRLAQIAGDRATKLCVPSPSHIFGEISWSDQIGGRDSVYADTDALKLGLVEAYRQFVQEYAAAGGKILQFDDCLWEMFADDNPNSPFSGGAIDLAGRELAAQFIEINNTLIDYGHSLGLTMWTHNCRGNYASRNMGAGSYAKIADLFFQQMRYDRFFLEWDDERAGSLDALAALGAKPSTEVVLGLLSSKTATLDDEARVRTMLDRACQIVPRERLYLSHQCGFASCDGGNELTEQQQWAKIDQGQRLAQEFWGE